MITLLATLVILIAAVVADRMIRRAESRPPPSSPGGSPAGPRPEALGPPVDADGCRVFALACYHPAHLFVVEEPGGRVSVGLDDLALHLLGQVRAWRLPRPGVRIRQGECVLEAETQAGSFALASPTSGRVVAVRGPQAGADPSWLLDVDVDEAGRCARNLIRGDLARGWMRDSVACLRALSEPRDVIVRGGLPDLASAAPSVRAMLITILLSAEPLEAPAS